MYIKAFTSRSNQILEEQDPIPSASYKEGKKIYAPSDVISDFPSHRKCYHLKLITTYKCYSLSVDYNLQMLKEIQA